MNTKNNKRRRESRSKIEKTFVNMLLKKSINKILVTEICKENGLNRTTFYANYVDVYDLADKVRQNIEVYFDKEFSEEQARTVDNFFKVIYDNQIMFKVYFKLAYDNDCSKTVYINQYTNVFFKQEHLKYHIAFFQAGINAMIKMWLDNDCAESPEEMAAVLKSEYSKRAAYFS